MYDLQYSKSWPAPNLVGLMALAQHHNIPTRLLDWTRRSYVAAYFAASQNLRSSPAKNSRMAVWILDRSLIQDISDVTDGISQPVYPSIQIVTAPGAVSVNLAAQSGLFTLLLESGDLNRPVQSRTLETEFTACSETHLWKLTVPSSEAEAVLDLCRLYGVTAATLFPGYDGVGFPVLDRARTWTDASLPIYL